VAAFGVIEENTDVDYFSFETGDGAVSLTLSPLASRPNLDIWAGIYNSSGKLVTESNPASVLSASFTNFPLSAGEYFVKVDGIGSHGVYNPATDSVEDPASPPWKANPPVGYSNYGSLGQYLISGTVVAPGTNTFSIAPLDAAKAEGNSGTTDFTFQVTRGGDTSGAATVDYATTMALPAAVGENYPYTVDGADFVGGALPSGTVSFAPGEASQTLVLPVVADGVFEFDESFVVVLSNPSSGWKLRTSTAKGTIRSDENRLAFAPANPNLTYQPEGDPLPSGGRPFVFTVTRSGITSVTTSVDWQVETAGLTNPASGADFVGGALPSGQLTFAPGQESKNITVSVLGDLLVEPDESFTVRLLNPSSSVPVSIHAPFATLRGTIRNDDVPLDFGDAPDGPYPTLFLSNGARHAIGGPRLGTTVDAETEGQQSSDATGDGGDDDGVTFTTALLLGRTATLDVVATGSGRLSAWVDFNDDGDWTDTGENVFAGLSVASGVNQLSFLVPVAATVTDRTIARFRLTTQTGISHTGRASDGEVEDYAVAIHNPAPADLVLTPSSINENVDTSGGNVEVGTLIPTDDNTGDTYNYTLVAGAGSDDNANFLIAGNKLLVKQGVKLDHEMKSSYAVRVNVNDGYNNFAKALTVTVNDLPEVDVVKVGNGTASRSMVTQVVVTFDQVMTLDSGAFEVRKRGAGGGSVDVAFTTATVSGKTVATLTFSGALVEGASGSLQDGNYDLTIVGTKARGTGDILLDGNLDGAAGGDYRFGTAEADAFFRMFGDIDGTRNVDFVDFFAFRKAFGKSTGQTDYDPEFDWDASGTVDFVDFFQFRSRFGKQLIFE